LSQPTTRAVAYRFDELYLDAPNRQLWRGNEPVPLNSKYFDVLLLLVANCGQLVEKQRIFDEIWEGVFVTDAALTQCIKDIRKQIGDDASKPRYIRTVPKHGYVFIGNAVRVDDGLRAPAATDAHPANKAALAQRGPTQLRPYKFLDYYTETDAALFVGREQEIGVIRSQILSHRTFIVHGRSGVGKSSLVRAGLIPSLKAEGHVAFVIRSFSDPLQGIIEGLTSLASGSEPITDVCQLVRQICKGEGRLIVFFLDQFEEFFLLATEDARRRSIDAISQLVRDRDLPVRVVFALREDMLAEMSALKPAIRGIFHHEYRLNRLDREQAARAITEPARAVGFDYEPELVTRLLDDLADDKGIDPPQLQIVCDSLFDARGSADTLSVELYERLGTASQLLTGYLERVLSRFRTEDFRVAREILTSLISDSGDRLVVPESALVVRGAGKLGCSQEQSHHLAEELVLARIVRRRNFQGEPWLELAHEFLTAEISRWITAEDLALRRARAVMERSLENHRIHQLMVGPDALELLLPFEERLGLTDEEADLLLASCLSRSRRVPHWLVQHAPSARATIGEAIDAPDAKRRVCAIEAATPLRDDRMIGRLRRVALWDRDLAVRKAASIALADSIGLRAPVVLSEPREGERAGPIRRAVSVAMIRDHEKQRVRLRDLPIAVGVLVVCGLMWVRLRRDSPQILHQGVAGLLGGAGSGLIGGTMLGLGLTLARHAGPIEAIGLILVLGSLGFFIGALGGAGVSFGMVSAAHVTYRHSRWWSVIGGAAGGALIGGSSNLLGVDAVRALFGQTPTGITGSLEGAAIGAGLSLGVVVGPLLIPRLRRWSAVVGASLGAMIAGVMLAVLGGNLFSASLEIVARMFANSQIRLDVLAAMFGQVSFGGKIHIVLGAIEGLLFGAGVGFGISATTQLDASSGESERPVSRFPDAVTRSGF
jgi:DNA-binding winged helix-turn-helix (wHTH) protein